LRALLGTFVADRPAAWIALVEAPNAGAAATARYEELGDAAVAWLCRGRQFYPTAGDLPEGFERMVVDGVAFLLRRRLLDAADPSTPALADEIAFYILEPIVGQAEFGRLESELAHSDPEPKRSPSLDTGDLKGEAGTMSTIEDQLVLAHFIVADDVERSRRFYTDVLGGKTVIGGEAGDEVTYVALANSWVIINVGGGPTDDKPTVTLETPPDPDRVSSFLNIRVADIQAVYDEWSARGAEFLTPPKQHETEIRCYVRDPDGYIIEVGQTTLARGWRPPS
jgi:catechol 2,3-dioxygenase-like lactoylglutathione lyase family enzyme